LTEKSQPEVEQQDNYDEINLFDLIQVILKWKKLIISIFVIFVGLAVAGSLMMEPVYRVSAVLSPGSITETSGKINYIEKPQNLSAIISKGSFHSQVLKQLKWDPAKPENNFQVQTDLPKDTTNVYIYIDSANTGKTLSYLNGLIDHLIQYYGERTRIITGKIKNDIEISKNKFALINETEQRLTKQLTEMRKNTQEILQRRDELLADHIGQTDTLALLLYSNTIQQNISYMDQLYERIENNKIKQEDLQSHIENLMLQLSSGSSSTSKKVLENGQFEGLVVVQEPYVNPERVKPNRKLIVVLAGVLGLFLGIFLAFFREFWETQKKLQKKA